MLPGVETAELHSLRATGRALVGPGSYIGRIRAAVAAGGAELAGAIAAVAHLLEGAPEPEEIDMMELDELRETVTALQQFSSMAGGPGGSGSGSDRGDDGSGSEDDASNATPQDPSRDECERAVARAEQAAPEAAAALYADGGSFQRERVSCGRAARPVATASAR